jgi:hypothetical protein
MILLVHMDILMSCYVFSQLVDGRCSVDLLALCLYNTP